jgi:hypothetical protein
MIEVQKGNNLFDSGTPVEETVNEIKEVLNKD